MVFIVTWVTDVSSFHKSGFLRPSEKVTGSVLFQTVLLTSVRLFKSTRILSRLMLDVSCDTIFRRCVSLEN